MMQNYKVTVRVTTFLGIREDNEAQAKAKAEKVMRDLHGVCDITVINIEEVTDKEFKKI